MTKVGDSLVIWDGVRLERILREWREDKDQDQES
jgi:hypothetical protein